MKRPMPPAIFFVFVALVAGLHFLGPLRQLVTGPWRWLGALPVAVGLRLLAWADGLFKTHRTTVKPFQESTTLVTSGPFRWSRNPMYLGFVMILLGLGWILGSVAALLPWIVFLVIMQRAFIRHEEAMLAVSHPEAWVTYRTRVRRWI